MGLTPQNCVVTGMVGTKLCRRPAGLPGIVRFQIAQRSALNAGLTRHGEWAESCPMDKGDDPTPDPQPHSLARIDESPAHDNFARTDCQDAKTRHYGPRHSTQLSLPDSPRLGINDHILFAQSMGQGATMPRGIFMANSFTFRDNKGRTLK